VEGLVRLEKWDLGLEVRKAWFLVLGVAWHDDGKGLLRTYPSSRIQLTTKLLFPSLVEYGNGRLARFELGP